MLLPLLVLVPTIVVKLTTIIQDLISDKHLVFLLNSIFIGRQEE